MRPNAWNRRTAVAAACLAALILASCGAPATPTGTVGGPSAAVSEPTEATATAAPTEPPGPPTPLPGATFEAVAEFAADPPPGAIAIEMAFVDGQFLFMPREVSASAGDVTFFLRNVKHLAVEHQLSIGATLMEEQAASPIVPAGRSVIFTVEDLPAGGYELWCVIEGHFLDRMVAKLTITP